jgi:hypothetical protein
VIVSAPAIAVLRAPVVSLAASLDAKDPDASKTDQFKNVFDSLTTFEEPPHQSAQQEGRDLRHSSTKKDPPENAGSRTKAASVPQIPSPPQTPSANLPRPSLTLQLSAYIAEPETHDSLEPTGDENDVKGPAAAASQTTPNSGPASAQQPDDPKPAPSLVPAASALTYRMQSDMPASSPAQKTAMLPVTARSSQTHSKETTASPRMPKTSVEKSISRPTEPLQAEPAKVLSSSVVVKPISTGATHIVVAAPAPQWEVDAEDREPKGTPQSESASTKLTAPSGESDPVVRSVPERSSPPVSNSPVVAESVPVSKSSGRDTTRAASSPSPASNSRPISAAAAPAPQAPLPQPDDAPSTPPASAIAQLPTPIGPPSPMEAVPLNASLAPMAPTTDVHEAKDEAPEAAGLSAPLHETPFIETPAPKLPLIPQAENFAFAVRMLGVESAPKTLVTTAAAPVREPAGPVAQPQSGNTQQPAPSKDQTPDDARNVVQPPASEAEKSGPAAPTPSNLLATQQPTGVTPHWNDAATAPAPELVPTMGAAEPAESTHSSLPIAAQETQLLAPELPKTSASSEILLHLTGNDESSAAIRVADRAGAVNVSVHASDPVLRETLRSNLGELSTQLNSQGWKADVIKPAAVAAQSGSQQDSHGGEQRGSQQQAFGGDRQPQRDRRSNGGQWRQELDQQISGGNAHSGGNG